MALHGRFWLEKKDGNLFGKYSNNESDNIYNEEAELRTPKKSRDAYEGTYRSSWKEGSEEFQANLEITSINKDDKRIFTLNWTVIKPVTTKKVYYVGKGMLCHDILIGDYHEGSKYK